MKKFILLNLFLSFSCLVTARAKIIQNTNFFHTTPKEAFKVKLHLSGNYIGGGYGLLAEYKLTEKTGLQSGIRVSSQVHPLFDPDNTEVCMYIGIPFTFRYYVGETKQFGWFGGLNIYHLQTLSNKRKGINPIGSSAAYQISAHVGFDYETKLGFIGGIDLFEQDLLFMLENSARPYSRILGVTVGYNFVKLFNILFKR